nr:HAD hydrolase family protein [Sedimentibacter sp.]
MINIEVPGRRSYSIENVVFDYNGTIAVNGIISPSIKDKISLLCEKANVYILTADTYGSAAKECDGLNVKLMTFPNDDAGECKAKIVSDLGVENTICFGNGYNDIKMFEAARISVAVLGDEGMCSGLVNVSDILVKSIEDGINLLLNTNRIIATLRK